MQWLCDQHYARYERILEKVCFISTLSTPIIIAPYLIENETDVGR